MGPSAAPGGHLVGVARMEKSFLTKFETLLSRYSLEFAWVPLWRGFRAAVLDSRDISHTRSGACPKMFLVESVKREKSHGRDGR